MNLLLNYLLGDADYEKLLADLEEEAAAEQNELDKKSTSLEEAEEMDSLLGESIFENEFLNLEEEELQQQQHYKEEASLKEEEGGGEEEGEEEETEIKINYQEIQMQFILSDLERKIMWDQYKSYVDEAVLTGLKEATLCRLVIYCIKQYFNKGYEILYFS